MEKREKTEGKNGGGMKIRRRKIRGEKKEMWRKGWNEQDDQVG